MRGTSTSKLRPRLAAVALATLAWNGAAHAQSIEDLQHMSIGDLANIDVTSVTKTPQSLSDAPAAIFVITHDDIVRSGATTVPEMLRLAPNLQVEQTASSQYVITARGLNGNGQAQNFSDKLLVLIDGRTVWTPLFSGVYWDMQQVAPDDIDRIEVISGPGAALWGANAVNGVINIITRKAGETQGLLVNVEGGSLQGRADVQFGGKIGDNLSFRAYLSDIYGGDLLTATGARAHDAWTDPQGGFRFDWTPTAADAVTLQGDAEQGDEQQQGAGDEFISGRNLLARWNHVSSNGATLQVQAFYDRESRETLDAGGEFAADTYDLDVQNSFAAGHGHQITWGGCLRTTHYEIQDQIGVASSLIFQPASGNLNLAQVFAQDSWAITDTLTLIGGIKLEDDPYSHLSALPSLRLGWKPNSTLFFWGAASQAIRAPTPFDEDVVEKSGPEVFLTGEQGFLPEKLTAYEGGARALVGSRLSISASVFYNVYDDLRSIEVNPATFLPLHWGNGLAGHTYGVEAWADYQVAPWWWLSAAVDTLSEHFHFLPGSSGLLGISQLGDDPSQQASLKSSMNLGSAVTLDADLRYVGALPNPVVPSYVELNGRLAWNVSRHVRLSVSGFNLLHSRHIEAPAPAEAIPRSVLAGLQWRF